MSEPMLETHALSKRYRIFRRGRYRIMDAFSLPVPAGSYEEHWALQKIDLTVEAGERLGIIGPNGAGKSTLLRILAGLSSATEGSLKVRGRIEALMELGTGFHPDFTGRENVFAALAYKGISGSDARQRFEEVAIFSELNEWIDRPVSTYSAGMYARLAFSVATAVRPEILIVDEVLSVGDAYFVGKCMERINELTDKSAATVVFVSHDLRVVQSMCTRVVWLKAGRIVKDGQPLAICKAYYQDVVEEEHGRFRSGLPAHATAESLVAGLSGETVRQNSVVSWGIPDPRIDSVQFLNAQGDVVPGVQEGSDLIVEVRYTSNRPVQRPVFGMSIYLPNGTPVCRAVSDPQDTRLRMIHGHGRVRFVFSPFYGGAGEYVLSASIYKPSAMPASAGFYDQHDRAYRFRVWRGLGESPDGVLLHLPYTVEHIVDAVEARIISAGEVG